VGVGSVQQDFTNGSIESTGINTHVAIEGAGFFVLNRPDGSRVYTRDGQFDLDGQQNLTNSDGYAVLGYTVDKNFELQSNTLSTINIPLGSLAIAQATTWATLDGNLVPSGTVAATPATTTSAALVDASSGAPITTATRLANLATAANPGVPVFAAGDVITLDADRGNGGLPTATFTVTNAATADVGSGATVAEFNEWLTVVLGINTAAPQATAAGVTVTANGEIQITSNLGEANALSIAEFRSSGATPMPFGWTTVGGDGAGVSTSFQVYDSLGAPVQVNVSFALIERTSSGATWRYYAESRDDSDSSPVLGTGTLSFNTSGMFAGATDTTILINRAGTGAQDPIQVTLDFSRLMGLEGESSAVRLKDRDGYPAGTLSDFSIEPDGTIRGAFTNGLTRPLGQLVLATFGNPEGLIATGNNAFVAGPNSGQPTISTPEVLGAGRLLGNSLEMSNVDLTREFIEMISATTAFSANGRVISTNQQLLNELLMIVR